MKDKANPAGLGGTVERTPRSPSGFLVLKTAGGSNYINPSEIAYLEVKGTGKAKEATVKQRRPELVLTVAKSDQKPTITVSYLTHGLGWAPSYLVEIADGKNLTIEMAASVRNEFAPLQDAEIRLMTGSPAIEFAQPAHEVVWTVSLPPGQEKTVRYSYQALILQGRERWACSW